jgi:predicted nucleic acid-binding Zn ribbon protein
MNGLNTIRKYQDQQIEKNTRRRKKVMNLYFTVVYFVLININVFLSIIVAAFGKI